MGIKERHDRERQAVFQSILDAAGELFMAEGYRNVSIRKIAERIEYSPAAIYSYFASKDDIYFALAEDGFHRLHEQVTAALGHEDPMTDVRAGWMAFYQFSKEHPAFFELMFIDRTVPKISEQWEGFDVMQQLLDRATASLQRAIDAGALPQTLNPVVAMHVLWGALTGPSVIGLSQRLAPGEDPDAMARDVFETMIAGFQAGTPLTFLPCECMSGHAGAVAPAGETSHES